MSVKKQYWYHRLPAWDSSFSTRLSWSYVLFILLLAIIGPLVANEKPFYCKLEGKTYFPLFTSVTEAGLSAVHPSYAPVDWQTTPFQSVWRPLIPYSHSSIDLKTGATVSPFQSQPVPLRMRHWLGTDIIGRDVMAGMIRGCRVSLMIGLGSMLLALLIGVPLGAAAAYWANRRKRFSFPVDPLVMGAVSIIDGFPGMFLILILVAILPFKGWLTILLVIALLRWPSMARYMRAEVFKMREMNYIKAAQLLNLPSWSILTKHIIPYAFRPIMVSFIFGISSAILAESSLSFLGIGLPPEQINWGRLLAQSRSNFDAWWLVLFPGLAVFFTLVSLYVIGNAIQEQVESVKE